MALALERRPGIVICDTAVPGMTGFDLYRQLAARDAAGAPRFLFISGEKTRRRPPMRTLAGVPVLVQAVHRDRSRDGAAPKPGSRAPRLLACRRSDRLPSMPSLALMSCFSCGCTLKPAFSADFTASSASL